MVPAYRNVGSHRASTRSPSCQEEGLLPGRSGSGAKAVSVVSLMVIVSDAKFAKGVSRDCRRPTSAVKQNPARGWKDGREKAGTKQKLPCSFLARTVPQPARFQSRTPWEMLP